MGACHANLNLVHFLNPYNASPVSLQKTMRQRQENHPAHRPVRLEAPARHRDLVSKQTWKVRTDSRKLFSDLPKGSQPQVENH